MLPRLPLTILELYEAPYSDVLSLQRTLHAKQRAGDTEQYLIICSHPPVITIGRSGKQSEVLAPGDILKAKNIEVIEIERGGQVTYHGPEQIVLYPILDLNLRKRDVGWYVRTLEEVVIRTVKEFGVAPITISGKTGVWFAGKPPTKIASIGVKMSRWCTFHGVSLNVSACHEGFSLIVPCGMPDVGVTSLEEQVKSAVERKKVTELLIKHFLELFSFEVER